MWHWCKRVQSACFMGNRMPEWGDLFQHPWQFQVRCYGMVAVISSISRSYLTHLPKKLQKSLKDLASAFKTHIVIKFYNNCNKHVITCSYCYNKCSNFNYKYKQLFMRAIVFWTSILFIVLAYRSFFSSIF